MRFEFTRMSAGAPLRRAGGEAVAPPLEHGSLVEQYAAMAHEFEPRAVDHVLRDGGRPGRCPKVTAAELLVGRETKW